MSLSIGSKVWSILGEGEERDVLITGSTAEAIDTAISITIDVMNNKYYDWSSYCAANGLDPETGFEPGDEEAPVTGTEVQARTVRDIFK